MSRTRTFTLLLLVGLAASLAISSCGGGGGGGSSSPTEPRPTPAEVHVVQVRDDLFEPKSITIQPGDTVRWVLNGSHLDHTVTARDGSFNSGRVFTRAGATYERRFDTTGTWDYSCQAHQTCCSMQGSVRVGSNAPPPTPGYE